MQNIRDAAAEWTNYKKVLVNRLSDCLEQQANVMNDLLKMVATLTPEFGEIEKKANFCIDTAKKNLLNQDPIRGRGHYKRLQEDCVKRVQ